MDNTKAINLILIYSTKVTNHRAMKENLNLLLRIQIVQIYIKEILPIAILKVLMHFQIQKKI